MTAKSSNVPNKTIAFGGQMHDNGGNDIKRRGDASTFPGMARKEYSIVRTNDIASPIVNQSPTPLQQQRVELAAQIIHRRTTINLFRKAAAR